MADAKAPEEEVEKPPRPDIFVNGIPQDSLAQAVFDKAAVAKKVFTSLDKDKDKKLSQAEFINGLKDLLKQQEVEIPEGAVEALWAQTDTNLDGFISWDEFVYRYVADLSPERNFGTRIELFALEDKFRLIMEALRPRLHLMYMGGDEGKEARALDPVLTAHSFQNTTKFNVKVLKALGEGYSAGDAKVAEGAAPPAWIEAFASLSKDDLNELFLECEVTPKGLLDLQRFDKKLGLWLEQPVKARLNYKKRLSELKAPKGKAAKPATAAKPPPSAGSAKGGAKVDKNKPPELNAGHQNFELGQHLVQEWFEHELFSHCKDVLLTGDNFLEKFPTRADPLIKNWNVTEIAKWSITENDGSRCYIFLTNTLKVQAMIRNPRDSKGIIVFTTHRMELNGLHTCEWLFHSKIFLDRYEDVVKVDTRPVKLAKNGVEQPLPRGSHPDFKDWSKHVGVPDIFVPAVKPRELDN